VFHQVARPERWSKAAQHCSFSTTEVAAATPPTKKSVSSISLLFQRLTSFFTGAGLMALATQYYIFDDVKNGNVAMLKKQRELEARIEALEKKTKH
jgi:hypothetical protein